MNRQDAAREPRHARAERAYLADARRDLGARGITLTGHAYVWDARRGAYNVTRVPDAYTTRVTRYMVCERPNGVTRSFDRPRFPMRVSQRNACGDVRIATISTARNPRVRALA